MDIRIRTAISGRIKSIRERKGLLAKNIAEQVDISRSYYSLMESGQRRIAAERMAEIARALDVPVAELYGESVPRDAGRRRKKAAGKHLKPINGKSLGRRLRPVFGDRTTEAVEILETWWEAPEEIRKVLEERVAPTRPGRQSRRKRRSGAAA